VSILLFCFPIVALLMETPIIGEVRGGVKMLLKAVAKLTKMNDARQAKNRVGPEPASTAIDNQSGAAASSTYNAEPELTDLTADDAAPPSTPTPPPPPPPAE